LRATALRTGDELTAVVTQPDRPRGRRLATGACPVKDAAVAMGLPVLAPESINEPASVERLRALAPDLIVIVAYGQILKPSVLAVPPMGVVNVHASLLPEYRGAAPIQWAIVRGATETGVTTMYVNERMDAGDVILQRRVPIEPEDTAGTLQVRLAGVGAALLSESLDLVAAGRAPRVPQDESRATYAPRLRKEDGRIDWTLPATAIRDRVRGFNPWPGCFCALPASDGRLRVLRVLAEATDARGEAAAGQVLDVGGAGPLVAAGEACVRLVEVQPEGRRAMRGGDFARGYRIVPGMALG
jgi:methionyl-tRNA formyltransferase